MEEKVWYEEKSMTVVSGCKEVKDSSALARQEFQS